MSEEDDKATIYDILSEPFYSEEEEELIREKGEEMRFVGEERRWSTYDPFENPNRRSSTDETREFQNDQQSMDFEMLDTEQSRQSSLNTGGFNETHQQCHRTIHGLMDAIQTLLKEKIISSKENESLQERLKDALSQLDKLLIRREADQKKICGLLIKLQRTKPPPPLPEPPTSPLACDVQMVDTDTAAENGLNWSEQHKECIQQLTQDPTGKAGEPPTGHLLGLWDPDVQIVSIGFELPE